MKIDVKLTEQSEGMWVATLEVDMEMVHSVAALSRLGALSSLSQLTEADADEALAMHNAVKASLVDQGRAQQAKESLDIFKAMQGADEGDN